MPASLCEKVINDSTKEKEDAINTLKKLSKDRTVYYEAGFAIHELALSAMKIYQSKEITIEEKRLLLSYVFSNSSMNVGIIKGNYTFAFEFLAEWIPKLNMNFELGKIRSVKGEKDAYAPLRSVLCPRQDSNLRPTA